MNRRVVITGLGVLAPGGTGTKAFWELITSGRTATDTISFFDPSPHRSRIAGQCDFDPVREGLSPQEIRRTDRAAQFAKVCAREAVADSGLALDAIEPGRLGVTIGSAVGNTMTMENEYVVLSDGGRKWLVDHEYATAHLYDTYLPSALAVEVARDAGAQGPVSVVSTGCTSGIDSVGYARDLILEGSADVMLAGGSDAPIAPITVVCFDVIKASSTRNDDPEHACRPFDRTRDGMVLAEGAAVLVLEEREHARRRGAHIYAELGGYSSRCNAFHMTGLKSDGLQMAAAVTGGLDEARLDPSAVDYVNAHGSGTKQNDRHETAAVKHSLGAHAYRTPMSGIKSMIGHSLGAIGSIELAACALAIEHDVIPPTANLHEPDPDCDLDYVPLEARQHRTDTAVCIGSGFGGFQSAMVLVAEKGR